jgi:hypothetical protein
MHLKPWHRASPKTGERRSLRKIAARGHLNVNGQPYSAMKELEGKALVAIGEGEKDAAALAVALKIGEDSARYLLTHSAARDAITLRGKSKSGETP